MELTTRKIISDWTKNLPNACKTHPFIKTTLSTIINIVKMVYMKFTSTSRSTILKRYSVAQCAINFCSEYTCNTKHSLYYYDLSNKNKTFQQKISLIKLFGFFYLKYRLSFMFIVDDKKNIQGGWRSGWKIE